MTVAGLLLDAFGRIPEMVDEAMEGLSADELTHRLDPEANSIAWLVWHLTRIQDDHVADVAGREQVWLADGWVDRFGLPFQPREHGYGHTAAQVGQVRAEPDLLRGYLRATTDTTLAFVRGLDDAALDRVVDRRFDPPVTLGVRLVSVIGDDLVHAGQAAFIRGVILRSRG